MRIKIPPYLFLQVFCATSIVEQQEFSSEIEELTNPSNFSKCNEQTIKKHEIKCSKIDKNQTGVENLNSSYDNDVVLSSINKEYKTSYKDKITNKKLKNELYLITIKMIDNVMATKFKENRESTKLEIKQSNDENVLIFINENKIPYEKWCKVGNFISNMADIINEFTKSVVVFYNKKKKDVDNDVYYLKDYDLESTVFMNIMNFYDIIIEMNAYFEKSISEMNTFFELISKKDTGAIEKLKDFESALFETLDTNILKIKEKGYDNIDLIIENFYKKLIESKDKLNELISN